MNSDGTMDVPGQIGAGGAGFVGAGGSLTTLNATQLTTGTVPADRMPAFTGDIATSGGSVATTLVNIGVTAGNYGNATQSAVLNIDAKGRATTASNATITPAIGSVTGLGAGVATALALAPTGSGSVVLSTSPTLVTPVIGTGGTTITAIRHGISGNLVAGVLVVANTSITANTRVFLTTHVRGTITLPAAYDAATRSAGVSFTITSSNVADTSTVEYMLVEP